MSVGGCSVAALLYKAVCDGHYLAVSCVSAFHGVAPVFILKPRYDLYNYIPIGTINKLAHVYLCKIILAHVTALCYNKVSKEV